MKTTGFEEKTIWITGASSGLGEALAMAFAKKGVQLILSARTEAKLLPVAEKCQEAGASVFVHAFDVSSKTEVNKAASTMLKMYPKIDLLINNAGIGQRSMASETSDDVEKQIMDTNFWSVVWLTKAVLPGMLARNVGHIAVVSSISGLFSFPKRSSYAASKHALMGYFEALSFELSKTNIAITLICPGRLNNDFSLEALTATGEKYGKMDESHKHGVPIEVAARKVKKAIDRKNNYLVFGGKETILWYVKRFNLSLFQYIASRLSHNS